MTEEQEMASQALKVLVEAVEIGQAAGAYTIQDSAQILSAIRFFKPDYGAEQEIPED